jgi:predicted enzyme related to lactoylglutathione lyase
MIENRTVPTDVLIPHVVYDDVEEAIEWLGRTFGFEEHFRYGEPVSGAQLHLGKAWIMLSQLREGRGIPAKLGAWTQSMTVFLDDVEGHYGRAQAAGAKIVEQPHETGYGEFQYAAEDLAGHLWIFSRHAKDLSPSDWGATIAKKTATSRLELMPRPRVCYLEIPAVDAHASAAFYEKVFGWNIRHRDTARPSFDDANGSVSGAWVVGRKSAGQGGLLAYVWVDGIDAVLKAIAASGGTVAEGVHHEEPGSASWIARFRDPAGNLMGLYQEAPR